MRSSEYDETTRRVGIGKELGFDRTSFISTFRRLPFQNGDSRFSSRSFVQTLREYYNDGLFVGFGRMKSKNGNIWDSVRIWMYLIKKKKE